MSNKSNDNTIGRVEWYCGLKDVCDSYIRTQHFIKMELNKNASASSTYPTV